VFSVTPRGARLRREQLGKLLVVETVAAGETALEVPVATIDDARTRDRVVRALHEQGPQSAGCLSERFGLTPAAVRRHLDALIVAGRVAEVPERKVFGKSRGRGRPAKLFALTDTGRETFPHAYDDLAVSALRYLRDSAGDAGDAAVADFARQRLGNLEARLVASVTEKAALPADRVAAVAALAAQLSNDGYAASVAQAGSDPTGVQLCQHHCPVAHVAAEFPQLCEAETAMFERLLGTHVQRLATIAHGDGICTTNVPAVTQRKVNS
jgi:predicted ArsR family transcriptional regulator